MSGNDQLVLGPIPYLWEPSVWRDFYFRIADEAPVDTVVVGEVVCSKRLHFHAPHEEVVVNRLKDAGKSVRRAGLGLTTLKRERQHQAKLLENAVDPIEAADISTLLGVSGRPHIIGPMMNTYSAATAGVYAARGAKLICLPPELPLASIEEIARHAADVEIEVLVFGRTPLAISARCAHARAKGHTKDDCRFVCGEDPDGMPVRTLDGQDFLTLNGVQTMSHTCHLVTSELPRLRQAGVLHFRLSPQNCDMVGVTRIFRSLLDGETTSAEAKSQLEAVYPNVPFSNGFLYGREGAKWINAGA